MYSKDHDLAFKQLIANPTFFKGLCQTYLPKDLLMPLDMNDIQLFRGNSESVHHSIVEGVPAKTEIADVLYEIKYKNQSDKSALLLVHIEHFSNPPRHTILRVQNYVFNALTEWQTLNPKKSLPTLIPIIYCHGKKPFSHPLNIYDLFSHPDQAKQYIENPLLIDLTQFTDEQLSQHPVISGAEIMMRHAFDKGGIISAKTRDLMLSHFGKLDDKLLKVVLKYSLNRFDEDYESFIQRFIELNLEREDLDMIMAERLRQQGVQQERYVIAQNMLKEGEPTEKIARFTGLPSEKIIQLKKDKTRHF